MSIAFSIRLSLARRFWNQILIWLSDKLNTEASSTRLFREMYSFRLYSNSSWSVCSLLNVVRWRRFWRFVKCIREVFASFHEWHRIAFPCLCLPAHANDVEWWENGGAHKEEGKKPLLIRDIIGMDDETGKKSSSEFKVQKWSLIVVSSPDDGSHMMLKTRYARTEWRNHKTKNCPWF